MYNTATIISFLYLFTKLKTYILKKTNKPKYVMLIIPLIMGTLSVITMMEPFEYNGMIFDLRSVPIFLISYLGGWKVGILSCVFPTAFRLYLGGDVLWKGIVLDIFLPIIIGVIFRDSKNIRPPAPIIGKKRFLLSFLIFSITKTSISWLSGVKSVAFLIKLQSSITIFSLITLFIMAVMINDDNRKLLEDKELKYLSTHDNMTALPNLFFFKDKVNKILNNNIDIAIAMVDIDYFKKYNDKHGHPKGDEVLKQVARILKENIRTSGDRVLDIVARYGGEEFIICFSNISNKSYIFDLMERIRIEIERYPFKGKETQPNGKLTISSGISLSSYDKSLEEVIEEADEALYTSKRLGRNRISFYREESKEQY